MKITQHALFLLLTCMVMSACRINEPEQDPPSGSQSTDAMHPSDGNITPATPSELPDTAFSATDTLHVVWSGASAVVSGQNASVSSEVSGGDVVVRNTMKNLCVIAEGTGAGSLRLYSDYKYQLILRSLTLHAASGPAICNQSHKSLYLRLEGTSALSDEPGYAAQNADGEDQKACFFSEGQILMYGTGSLSISANCRHGI